MSVKDLPRTRCGIYSLASVLPPGNATGCSCILCKLLLSINYTTHVTCEKNGGYKVKLSLCTPVKALMASGGIAPFFLNRLSDQFQASTALNAGRKPPVSIWSKDIFTYCKL